MSAVRLRGVAGLHSRSNRLERKFRALFSWKAKQLDSAVESTTVGLAIVDGEATAIACDGEVEGNPNVIAWTSFPAHSLAEIESGLSQFVEAHALKGWPCRCVLPPADYSLRLIERPANIPDDELVDATRWLVRDLIEFDVEEAALTILLIPQDNNRARTPRMFIVAARHDAVNDLATIIQGTGLRIDGFDIVESAMLGLEARLPETVAGSAALAIDDKSSVLTLSLSEHLYLARSLHVDADSLDAAAQLALDDPSPSNPDVVERLDPLLLDIQRSLDYYESEYGQATASRLTLFPSRIDLSPLLPALGEALRPVQVDVYEMPRHFQFAERPPSNAYPSLMLAGGAAVGGLQLLGDSLLPVRFKGIAGGFGLVSVAKIAAALVIFLGAYWAFSWVALGQQSETLAALEAELEQVTNQVESQQSEAAALASARDPEARIRELRAERDARLTILRDRRRIVVLESSRGSRSSGSGRRLAGTNRACGRRARHHHRRTFARGGQGTEFPQTARIREELRASQFSDLRDCA